MKGVFVFCLGVISVLYLLNIGVGVIELLPDSLPIIGNLDEAGATMLLLLCLKYFGLEPAKIFEKDSQKQNVIEV